jgi:hypothetical protein
MTEDIQMVPLYCDTEEESRCILGREEVFLFVCYVEANSDFSCMIIL